MIRRPPHAPSPLAALVALGSLAGLAAPALGAGQLHDPREVHLADVVQLTAGGENAEAYWSPDGERLVFQSTRPPYACDQMFTMSSRAPGPVERISTGKGRTTCGYFDYPNGKSTIYATTEAAGEACPPAPDHSQGYVWAVYDSFDIVRDDGTG